MKTMTTTAILLAALAAPAHAAGREQVLLVPGDRPVVAYQRLVPVAAGWGLGVQVASTQQAALRGQYALAAGAGRLTVGLGARALGLDARPRVGPDLSVAYAHPLPLGLELALGGAVTPLVDGGAFGIANAG